MWLIAGGTQTTAPQTIYSGLKGRRRNQLCRYLCLARRPKYPQVDSEAEAQK
jgi:hypothetical protein